MIIFAKGEMPVGIAHTRQKNGVLRPGYAVTVSTSAIQLAGPDGGRMSVNVFNNSADGTPIYLGRDNTVTAANGLPIPGASAFTDSLSQSALWAIRGSGGLLTDVDTRILIVGT